MGAHTLSTRGGLRAALALTLATAMTATVAATASATPTGAERVGPGVDTTPQAKQLAELSQRAADTGSLGVIVRVDQGKGPTVEIARQSAWTRADHILKANDQFRVASNTKTMTATLILQLVAEGKVDLADPVEDWLPGVVPGGRAITIKMLLNHTSGLDDFLLHPDFLPSLLGLDERQWTPEQLLALTTAQTAPGEQWSYSNANYQALALVLEKATGQHLGELVEQRITRPLGMTHTYLATDAGWRPGPGHATGYEPDAEHLAPILPPGTPEGIGFAGPERNDHVNTTDLDASSWTGAAGGMVSTARDWDRFLGALMSGKLLPSAQMKQMRTTVAEDPADPEGDRYGLGLMEVRTPCGTVWGHTGGLPGYSSEIYTDRTGRRSVTVLNTTNFGVQLPAAATANKTLVDAAACAMLGKPLPTAPTR
ncbi:serine hydrolase [Streptomyces camponoticapitis]|uniref:Serine hydrolase n=1 Tax=Streptomyces camponoticapitis TaxID=1616125 RepID=A0ABQ2EQS7_9ACTN|nr:serine hydrolase domain-containing protein [Streptomyces camponoticapitis]GGK16323.1 serine hydrolase [Streptomyces camponoticapitis]